MYKCDYPDCHFKSEKPQGLSAHKMTHQTPEQKAARQAKRLVSMRKNKGVETPVDEIFERVEKATKILFPDPSVFYERFEEIAELRHNMLQVLKR